MGSVTEDACTRADSCLHVVEVDSRLKLDGLPPPSCGKKQYVYIYIYIYIYTYFALETYVYMPVIYKHILTCVFKNHITAHLGVEFLSRRHAKCCKSFLQKSRLLKGYSPSRLFTYYIHTHKTTVHSIQVYICIYIYILLYYIYLGVCMIYYTHRRTSRNLSKFMFVTSSPELFETSTMTVHVIGKNGSILWDGTLNNSTPYTPYVAGIYWVFPLFLKVFLGGEVLNS